MITRHFIDVDGRRVHYRRAGSGPTLLMCHQSPRSSAEYAPLMARWAEHFTCIAPDTPGFGQSDPLPGEAPDIDAFGDAVVAFVERLGLKQVGAYGFHSGGIILMNALRRYPERFTALGCGGYAVWTPAEMAVFSDRYLPPFTAKAYGEHLTWLWHRVLEQSWFFPWFDTCEAARLPGAHDDPLRVDAVVREMLDSGDAYRAGYGAVLRAVRDLPAADATVPPVLIAAYEGDPLQTHIDRLGALPSGWRAAKVSSPDALEASMLAHLRAHPATVPPVLPEAEDEGFIAVAAGGFSGLVHWRGARGAELTVHPPGGSVACLGRFALAIDLPGHGLSDPWPDAPPTLGPWRQVVAEAAAALGAGEVHWLPSPRGEAAKLFPDLRPDRFGSHLLRAWSIARASVLFDPWYAATAGAERAFDPADLAPDRIALAARSLLRATAAQAYMNALGEG